jgi:hypothetical protein
MKTQHLRYSWALPNDSKPIFRRLQRICCTYESLKCLDVQIWRFLCWQTNRQNRRTEPITLPLAHARGVISIHHFRSAFSCIRGLLRLAPNISGFQVHSCQVYKKRARDKLKINIVGKFRGVQFSRFLRISGYPQKLDPRNISTIVQYINGCSKYCITL